VSLQLTLELHGGCWSDTHKKTGYIPEMNKFLQVFRKNKELPGILCNYLQ